MLRGINQQQIFEDRETRGRFSVLTSKAGDGSPSPAPRQADPPQKSVGDVQRGLPLSKT